MWSVWYIKAWPATDTLADTEWRETGPGKSWLSSKVASPDCGYDLEEEKRESIL